MAELADREFGPAIPSIHPSMADMVLPPSPSVSQPLMLFFTFRLPSVSLWESGHVGGAAWAGIALLAKGSGLILDDVAVPFP